MKHQSTIILCIALFICMYCFLVGIQGLSHAIRLMSSTYIPGIFQKISNPFTGLFIGIFATVLMQSSSATTSIVVSLVSTQAISLHHAIPMLMGANVGTTITNTLVAFGHIKEKEEFQRAIGASTLHDFFNITIVAFLFPLEYYFKTLSKTSQALYTAVAGHMNTTQSYQSPLKSIVTYGSTSLFTLLQNPILYALTSVLLIFAALRYIIKILKTTMLTTIKKRFNHALFSHPLKSWAFGMFFTIFVQSSSITTSLTIPLAASNTLSLLEIYPYVVGANLGTGITAFIAASTLNPIAMIAAIASLLFNLFGFLCIYPIPIIGNIPIWCAQLLAKKSIQYKVVPIVYISILFLMLPLLVIVTR